MCACLGNNLLLMIINKKYFFFFKLTFLAYIQNNAALDSMCEVIVLCKYLESGFEYYMLCTCKIHIYVHTHTLYREKKGLASTDVMKSSNICFHKHFSLFHFIFCNKVLFSFWIFKLLLTLTRKEMMSSTK